MYRVAHDGSAPAITSKIWGARRWLKRSISLTTLIRRERGEPRAQRISDTALYNLQFFLAGFGVLQCRTTPCPSSFVVSMAQKTLPPAVLSGLKEALGCMVVGTALSTWCVPIILTPSSGAETAGLTLSLSRCSVYGVSILQAYLYFRNSNQDSKGMRTFVSVAT